MFTVLGFEVEGFGSELVESLLVVLEGIAELADAPQEPFAFAQVLRGVFSPVETASEALNVVDEPDDEVLAAEAVLKMHVRKAGLDREL